MDRDKAGHGTNAVSSELRPGLLRKVRSVEEGTLWIAAQAASNDPSWSLHQSVKAQYGLQTTGEFKLTEASSTITLFEDHSPLICELNRLTFYHEVNMQTIIIIFDLIEFRRLVVVAQLETQPDLVILHTEFIFYSLSV